MKTIVKWIWIGCWLTMAAPWALGVGVGSTQAELEAEFGYPEMAYSRGGNRILLYFGEEVVVKDGVIEQMPSNLAGRITAKRSERKEVLDQERAAARARPKPQARNQQASRGSTRAKGIPYTRTVNGKTTRGVAGVASPAKVISNGGKKVDLSQYTGNGKITIVDFYADWCGPCRMLAPYLDQMANADTGVQLVKIDILKWSTPVAKQYKIKSIPNVRVYDRSGRMVGKPTSSPADIQKYIDQAK